MAGKIIIGTRGSDLALWQARFLQEELEKAGYPSELKIIKTKGDKIQHISLEKIEGKGFFTKEIEDALLEHTIDIAVHSHKDLPTEETPGLTIAGVSYREDPSELLLIKKESVDQLKEFHLKENALIGTSSSRRVVQLKFYRPDLQLKDIRGNVPTRIEKLRKGEFDAILLAAAGVKRLQLNCSDLHELILPSHVLVPAPAQGVLSYQCRVDDDKIKNIVSKIHHPEVAETISIEREVMRLFHGGCHMPLGVYCEKQNNSFHIWAMQSSGNIDDMKRLFFQTNSNERLAEKIFHSLKTNTAKSIFITTQPGDHASYLKLLNAKGFSVTSRSLVEIEPLKINNLPDCDWLFFTSKNGVRYFFEQVKHIGDRRIAAIGEETAKEIRKNGYPVAFTGTGDTASIAEHFIQFTGNASVVFPQALNSHNNLIDFIAQSLKVEQLPVYKNQPLQNSTVGHYDIVVFTSAMNAGSYLQSNKVSSDQVVIAIGESTKQYLEEMGLHNILVPPFKNLLSVSDLICGLELLDN